MFSSKARLWLLLLLVILVGPVAYAQTVTVTASGVVDPNGNLYSNGTISAFLVTSSGTIPKVGTAPVNPALGPFPVDGTASFSVQVTPNAIIIPGGTQWVFTVCGTSVNLGPQPQPLLQVCFNSPLITVTSPGPQDITSQLNAVAKILGPKTGGGGGGGGSGTVGPGTINTVSKFVTLNQVGNSSVTDNGVAPTREPNGNNTATSGDHDEWTVDAGGTIAGRLVCVTGNRLVQTCGLGATSGIVGVADSTVAAGGTVSVCWAAKCNVTAATPTVVNDWLVASVTVAGEADDVGAAKPSNTQAFPADSTVLAGQNVLSTLLSLDTINAQISGSGTVQPCGPGVAYYPGPGVNTIINCIPNPSTPAAVPQLFNATPGGSPGWNLPGVPVSAQVGTNYTWQLTDRLKLITGNNASPTTWTGPALISNYAAAFFNLNAGPITFTPASGQVNGGASQKIPQNWFGFHYTDNANTFMPVMPTLAAFPNCSGAIIFTSATGLFGCNSSSSGYNLFESGGIPLTARTTANFSGGITCVDNPGATRTDCIGYQSSAPAPNVNIIGASNYIVTNSENSWDDKFIAGGPVIVTLPQANTVTISPFVSQRVDSSATACTSCAFPAMSNVAGNRLIAEFAWNSASIGLTNVTDSAGNSWSRIQPDLNNFGFGNENISLWQANNIAAATTSNVVTATMSSSITIIGIIEEYTTTVSDKAGSSLTAGTNVQTSLSIPISNINEVVFAAVDTNSAACPSGWISRGATGLEGIGTCEKIFSASSTASLTTVAGSFNGAAIIMADYAIGGIASFTAGWEFYVENATPNCSTVAVVPTVSTINTATQSGLTSYVVPCGMTARFRSDGTNYEMFQLVGNNRSLLTTAYTNATTAFTNTGLYFFLNTGQQVSGQCKLPFKGTATTAAPILQFTGPAAPTTVTANLNETLTAGSSPTFYSNSTTGNTFALGLGATAIVTTAADMPMTLDFGIVNGTTAGTVNLQAKSSGAGTITLEAGASCTIN